MTQLTGLRYVGHPLVVVKNPSKTGTVVRDPTLTDRLRHFDRSVGG
jgi:hypothetical protein